MWWFLHHATVIDGRFGRFVRARIGHKGTPLEGVTDRDFKRAGVERLPTAIGAQGGQPLFAGGRTAQVANIVWATGFRQDFSWIKLPIFDDAGEPRHHRGVVATEPGLYFLGLPFQYAISSVLIGGVGRDADYVVTQIGARSQTRPAGAAPDERRRAGLASHG
jgi:putative flavoprotein involved in K+ transport